MFLKSNLKDQKYLDHNVHFQLIQSFMKFSQIFFELGPSSLSSVIHLDSLRLYFTLTASGFTVEPWHFSWLFPLYSPSVGTSWWALSKIMTVSWSSSNLSSNSRGLLMILAYTDHDQGMIKSCVVIRLKMLHRHPLCPIYNLNPGAIP